jgi:Leucine Rich repeat
LSLAFNCLTDQSAPILFEILLKSSLKRLSLVHNKLGDKAGVALAGALPDSHLTYLDLEGNWFVLHFVLMVDSWDEKKGKKGRKEDRKREKILRREGEKKQSKLLLSLGCIAFSVNVSI